MHRIHVAAHEGNVSEIERLVHEGVSPNLKVQAEFLLQPYGPSRQYNVGGCGPLHIAACKGHEEVVSKLLHLGADPVLQNDREAYNKQPIHRACLEDHAGVVSLLLKAGAGPFFEDRRYGSLLGLAAIVGSNKCLTMLLAPGSDYLNTINDQDRRGNTALHWACFQNQCEATRILLEAGADPTIRDNGGKTPLDRFNFYNRCDSCTSLLKLASAISTDRAVMLFKARKIIYADASRPPTFLGKRVHKGDALPKVHVVNPDPNNEKLVASLKYAMGIEGGGGVHAGPGPAPHGMLKDVFVELCAMMTPTWVGENVQWNL